MYRTKGKNKVRWRHVEEPDTPGEELGLYLTERIKLELGLSEEFLGQLLLLSLGHV